MKITDEDFEIEKRRRRWHALAEDGAMFGLTSSESEELAKLEREFGKTDLPEDMRS